MGDTVQPTSESEVWEVRYDTHIQSSSIGTGPTRILPVMMCSEDGILAVLEQGLPQFSYLIIYYALLTILRDSNRIFPKASLNASIFVRATHGLSSYSKII